MPPYDESVVKTAFRTLAKTFHPDHGGAVEGFKSVVRAKELLLRRLGGDPVEDDDVEPWESEPQEDSAPPPTQARTRVRTPKDMGWTRHPPFRGSPRPPHSTDTGRRTGFEDRDVPWSPAEVVNGGLGTLVGYRVILDQLLLEGRNFPGFRQCRAEIGVSTKRPFGISIVVVPRSAVRAVRTASGLFHFEDDPATIVRFGGRFVGLDRDEDGLFKRFIVEAS